MRESVVSWSIDWDNDNSSDIKGQLKRHLDEINQMPIVADVSYERMSGKDLAQKLDDILRQNFGYKIENQNFGTITFDAKAIKHVINYVNNDSEAAALLTAPYVLKRGKAIGGHKNHKEQGYPSVTFAAPVKINGKTGNVAVAVLYGDKGRIHAVRVLDPSGNAFVLTKKTDAKSTSAGNTLKESVVSAINSASIERIPQKNDGVNRNGENNSDERSSKQTHVQKVKENANYTKDKVYTKKEVRESLQAIIDSVANDHDLMLSGDVKGVILRGEQKEKIIDKLTEKLNVTPKDKRATTSISNSPRMRSSL